MSVRKIIKYLLYTGVAAVLALVAVSYLIGSNPIMLGAAMMNELFSLDDPKPKIEFELREAAEAGDFAPNALAAAPGAAVNDTDWTAYNRTVYGDRYSPLAMINAENAGNLEVVCTFDTDLLEAFQSGLLAINGALIGTTAENIFSLNPETCDKNWWTHKDSGLGMLPVNRGAVYTDGKLVRGFWDGYVRAFDAKTGAQLWETFIGDPQKKLWLSSAASAWNGMVFYGTAGGDSHNIRGRVFGIDAATGAIKWQTFTVPKQADDTVHAKEGTMPADEMKASWRNPPDVPVTGGGVWTSETIDPSTGLLYVPVGNPAPDFVASIRPGSNLFTNTVLVLDAATGDYVRHYSVMPDDWHDWDVSNPPILITSRGGKDMLAFHPKDGHLYGFDRTTNEQLYRQPVTKMLNTDVRFEPEKPVYFCPGSVGGGEWSSAAFDPRHNLIFTGENEWCTTAKIEKDSEVARARDGSVWFGVAYINPFNMAGLQDPPSKWGGWFYASDADTGDWKWRARTNYPIVGSVTPTAGDIVAFGDMGGVFHILRASDGKELFNQRFDGAIAGGVITFAAKGKQYIAFTAGVSHPQWPVPPKTGKIVVLGLKE